MAMGKETLIEAFNAQESYFILTFVLISYIIDHFTTKSYSHTRMRACTYINTHTYSQKNHEFSFEFNRVNTMYLHHIDHLTL